MFTESLRNNSNLMSLNSTYKVLDDLRASELSAVSAMMEECEEETLSNVTLWTSDDSGVLQPPQAVGNALCPSDCSGNGRCVNSTCICDAGYLSADCTINEGIIIDYC